jgi:hypothetical protein
MSSEIQACALKKKLTYRAVWAGPGRNFATLDFLDSCTWMGLPAPGGETTAALEEGRAGGCWGVLEVTALDVTLLSASRDGRALSSDDRVIGC